MPKKENMGDFLFLSMIVVTLIIVLFPEGVDAFIDGITLAASKMLQLFDEAATQYLLFRGHQMTHEEMREEHATSDNSRDSGE